MSPSIRYAIGQWLVATITKHDMEKSLSLPLIWSSRVKFLLLKTTKYNKSIYQPLFSITSAPPIMDKHQQRSYIGCLSVSNQEAVISAEMLCRQVCHKEKRIEKKMGKNNCHLGSKEFSFSTFTYFRE